MMSRGLYLSLNSSRYTCKFCLLPSTTNLDTFSSVVKLSVLTSFTTPFLSLYNATKSATVLSFVLNNISSANLSSSLDISLNSISFSVFTIAKSNPASYAFCM